MKGVFLFLFVMYSCTNVSNSEKKTSLDQRSVGQKVGSDQIKIVPIDTVPLKLQIFLKNFKDLTLPTILEDSMFWNRKKMANQEVRDLLVCLGSQNNSGVFEYGWHFLANRYNYCVIYTKTIESVNEDGIQEVTLSTRDTLGNCISNMILGFNSDQRSCKIQIDKTKIMVSQYKHIVENHELVAVDVEDYEFFITPKGTIEKKTKASKYRRPAKIVFNSKGLGIIKIL